MNGDDVNLKNVLNKGESAGQVNFKLNLMKKMQFAASVYLWIKYGRLSNKNIIHSKKERKLEVEKERIHSRNVTNSEKILILTVQLAVYEIVPWTVALHLSVHFNKPCLSHRIPVSWKTSHSITPQNFHQSMYLLGVSWFC